MVCEAKNIIGSESRCAMKIYKLLFFIIISALFLVGGIKTAQAAFDPWRPLCVGIQGKFVATNWKGGPIQVGCVGDDGGATSNPAQRCTGQVIKDVRPGETFKLTKCSCWGSNKGCLKVGKELKLNPLNSNNRRTITVVKSIKDIAYFKSNSCTINSARISNYCGANGAHLLDKNIRITCQVPPSSVPTRNPSQTPTPSVCVGPEPVANVKVTCPNCF